MEKLMFLIQYVLFLSLSIVLHLSSVKANKTKYIFILKLCFICWTVNKNSSITIFAWWLLQLEYIFSSASIGSLLCRHSETFSEIGTIDLELFENETYLCSYYWISVLLLRDYLAPKDNHLLAYSFSWNTDYWFTIFRYDSY